LDVVWSDSAWDDLQAIVLFIARDSARYAEDFGGALHDKGGSLSAFPERGRIIPEFADPALRELFHHPYRILYRVEVERVIVIAVIHGSRDLTALWSREGRGDPHSIT
jgi:toxin ParE1/3/4